MPETAQAKVKTDEATITRPFTVHRVAGYGRSAWQVRDGNGYVLGRLVREANANEMARLLNAASEAGL